MSEQLAARLPRKAGNPVHSIRVPAKYARAPGAALAYDLYSGGGLAGERILFRAGRKQRLVWISDHGGEDLSDQHPDRDQYTKIVEAEKKLFATATNCPA